MGCWSECSSCSSCPLLWLVCGYTERERKKKLKKKKKKIECLHSEVIVEKLARLLFVGAYLVLTLPHRGIQSVLPKKRLVATSFGHLSAVQNENFVLFCCQNTAKDVDSELFNTSESTLCRYFYNYQNIQLLLCEKLLSRDSSITRFRLFFP